GAATSVQFPDCERGSVIHAQSRLLKKESSSLRSSQTAALSFVNSTKRTQSSGPKAAAESSSVDVSFIIVSWNAKDYLLKCLASLRATGRGYSSEIFVVDNASTDGSQEAVRQQFPEVILIENSGNVGFARANNVALAQAKGRYFCLLNSD